MRKHFFLVLLMVSTVLFVPACRQRRKQPEPRPLPPVAETTTPQPAEHVQPPETEFPRPSEPPEISSEDLDELNRIARQRGWIRDAFFAFDASTLNADSQDALTQSAEWLRAHPDLRLRVEGHCDERGTEQYNLALGERRASTAAQYLETLGIDASRIQTVSYGEERPFAEGSTEEAWAQNRRAHLVLVKR